MASDILIVDDEADIRDLVAGILEDEGFHTRTARDSDSALTEISNRRPHLVFLDIWLQGSKLDGLQLLEQIKKDHADVPVVMISGHGNIETAVAAIKRGAYDFIEKPSSSRMPATRSRISASSSTIRMSLAMGSRLPCQLPVGASIFASSLVALAASLVPPDGAFVSSTCGFASEPGGFASAFGA